MSGEVEKVPLSGMAIVQHVKVCHMSNNVGSVPLSGMAIVQHVKVCHIPTW